MPRLYFITLFSVLLSNCANADSFTATVTKVLGGKTLIVTDESKTEHLVRLAGIGIPAPNQPGHDYSRDTLSRLTLKKQVKVEWDRYEKGCRDRKAVKPKCAMLAKLILDGEDVNLEMIRRGAAKHDTSFIEEQSTPDRSSYSEAENRAREKQLGMWNREISSVKKKKKRN